MAKTEKTAFVLLVFFITIGISYKFYKIKNEDVGFGNYSRKVKIPNRKIGSKPSKKSSVKPSSKVKKSEQKQRTPKIYNLNTASAEDLTSLPNIGPSMARKIISYRSIEGPFKKKTDLMRVSGISVSRYKKLEPYIKIE